MRWRYGVVEELVPILLFFVVQQVGSFQAAVSVMCVSTTLLVGFAWWYGRHVPRFALISTIALLLFAVPSVVMNNPTYFKVSDTILDGSFALLLFGSLLLRTTVLEYFFGQIFALPDAAWRTLTMRWGAFFLALAVLNEYIRTTQTTDVWSYYKLISTVGIVLFGLWQFRLSARERIESESNWLGLRI